MTSIQSSRLILMVCAFFLSVASMPSQGALVKWALTDVTLHGLVSNNDSRTYTAVGSFLYDAQTHTVEDWDIVTKEDTDLQTFIFTPALSNASASRTPGPPDTFTFNNASGFLTLVTPPLTDAGGTEQLVGGHLFGAFDFADADVAGGSLTGTVVSEPISAAYLAFGIAALFGICWGRTDVTLRG